MNPFYRKNGDFVSDVWQFEKIKSDEGFARICGVDEAGRGPLAGPVCAAAVILPFGVEIKGLNDSKKLSEKKREALFDEIIEKAVGYGIAFAEVSEIEELNILNASFLAMRRAIEKISPMPDFALIDGNMVRNIPIPAQSIVKGDSLSASVSAASILAKVSRDRLLKEYDAQFPEYGFLKHKGYPTKAHYEAIEKYGPCVHHRLSFLKGRV